MSRCVILPWGQHQKSVYVPFRSPYSRHKCSKPKNLVINKCLRSPESGKATKSLNYASKQNRANWIKRITQFTKRDVDLVLGQTIFLWHRRQAIRNPFLTSPPATEECTNTEAGRRPEKISWHNSSVRLKRKQFCGSCQEDKKKKLAVRQVRNSVREPGPQNAAPVHQL